MTVRALRSATPASEPSPTPDQFRFLPLTDIDESATNPRATCSADALNELAASIRLRGVLQPILVRAVGDRYELIAGARRLRAAVLAALTTIPARVIAMNDQAARETQIIENLQREDVHPLEEAEAYENLIASDGAYTVGVLATKVGKSRHLRLHPPHLDAPDSGGA
jgi:ParB family chromosome partitioning protein